MKVHGSLHAIATYEAKYINSVGYWAAFCGAAYELRAEYLANNKGEGDAKIEVWAIIAYGYMVLVVGLRAEFYSMAAEDSGMAKLVLPALENRS